MNGCGKTLGLWQAGFGCFAPDQVAVRSIGQTAGDRGIQSTAHAIETLGSALTGEEALIRGINIRSNQVSPVGISTGNQESRNTKHIGGETGRDKMLDSGLRGDKHFAAHMSAFLL